MAANAPLISVIVPAHNEERNLPRTFAALTTQTLPRDQFEVVLLSDRSTDRTVAMARTFTSSLALRIELLSSGSVAEVRNQGAALARAPILCFLDADCVPRPDFLERALRAAATATLWGADYLLPPDATWVGRTWAEFQATAHTGDTDFLPGGTLLIHQADFVHLGGFRAGLETSEDVELCRRARMQFGYAVIAHPELGVVHFGTPRTLRAFLRQNQWHGKHVLRAFLAHPTARTGVLLGLSGWMLVSATITPIALISGELRLFAGALGCLLLPPLLLAGMRAAGRRRLDAFPALAVLYLVYLLARAAALVHGPARGVRT